MSGDMFQCLRFDVIKELFSEEFEYLKARRWDFIEHGHSDYLTLLNENKLSTWHLHNIRVRMDEETKAKAEEEKNKVNTSGLTGSHRNY